ncbi:MAG TPA: ATP-binding protein [Candidatus Saccharimonadales bacterium]|nr:ATP-binding protein [Candidatus Saccharimonadales bacterium]
MFRSARLKLTIFYLAALLAFSLISTNTIRLLAENEYARADDAQRHEVSRLLLREFTFELSPPQPNAFISLQSSQAALTRQHLDEEIVWVNVGALIIGGLFSYWFAGRTLQPIEEAHEAQTRFAADASHELRTPLTNMKAENEVFLRQDHFTETEARDLIRSNLEEVQRLEDLSTNLLDLTRYGQTALSLTPLAVNPLVTKAVTIAAKRAKERQVKIVKQLSEAHIAGNHDSLLQLISIVLDNAIKYGPAGGTITLKGRHDGNHYVLSVIDQGPGIDEADLPYIFDRLYRGDKARSNKAGGYGLGLALAKEIAKVNHMTITARNIQTGGARFDLYFNSAK